MRPKWTLQDSPLGQACPPRPGDDNMVMHGDSEDLPRIRKLARNAQVFRAGLGVAAGMVVNDYDSRGPVIDGCLEYLTGVDEARIQGASRKLDIRRHRIR